MTAVLALLGPPAGWLWAAVAPDVREIVINGAPLLADPESQAMIGTDGRYAVITLTAGLLCAIAAYLAGGRGNDVPLLLGLAAGGLLAGLLAWQTGHHADLETYRRALRAAGEGDIVVAAVDLHARGLVVCWALAAVAGYGTLEAAVARLAPRDDGGAGAGEPDQVGGGELDLQTAPPGRDVDGREP